MRRTAAAALLVLAVAGCAEPGDQTAVVLDGPTTHPISAEPQRLPAEAATPHAVTSVSACRFRVAPFVARSNTTLDGFSGGPEKVAILQPTPTSSR